MILVQNSPEAEEIKCPIMQECFLHAHYTHG